MVPLPQKKLHLAVLVTTPSLSWMGRQMWKIWGIRSSKSDERFKKADVEDLRKKSIKIC